MVTSKCPEEECLFLKEKKKKDKDDKLKMKVYPPNSFSVVSEAEVDVFLDFLCFPYDPMDFGSLFFGSSAFLKSSLYIWMCSVLILLKPRILSINLLTCEMRAIIQVV